MASYSPTFKPSVHKDLRHLPKTAVARVMKQVEQLKTESLPRQAIKLSGAERLYRIRVGDYRIVYEVNVPSQQITVHHIRHRREVYRAL